MREGLNYVLRTRIFFLPSAMYYEQGLKDNHSAINTVVLRIRLLPYAISADRLH